MDPATKKTAATATPTKTDKPKPPEVDQRKRSMGAEVREAIRWTLRDAEAEFPVGRDTLSKRLHQQGEQPGDDGKYSTRQICAAVFRDKDAEQARLAKEQADRLELDNAERRRTLIPVADALTLARRFTFAAIAKIRGVESLSVEERNAVIAELRGLKDCDFSALPDADE